MSPKDLLNQIKPLKNTTPPDWLGIRQVSETTTFRSARDGKVEHNSVSSSKGAMVEVLVDGQFGYSATPDLTLSGIQKLMKAHAFKQKAPALILFSILHLQNAPLLRHVMDRQYKKIGTQFP